MDDQDPVAISSKAFQIVFGIALVIAVFALSPLSGWLFGLQADAPVQGPTLVGVLKSFECGVDTMSDADGNSYNTVAIGEQCWMAENLNVGTRVGISTTQTDNATIEKWCYSDTDANCDTNNNPNNPDGGLYQWDEMMQYSTTEGAQGICPAGWHIPTDDEWKTLELTLGMSPVVVDNTGFRGTDQGTQLKPNGSSGFEGNLAGFGYSSLFSARDLGGRWWSSSEVGSDAWIRSLFSTPGNPVFRAQNDQSFGLSVRCLRDDFGGERQVTIASTPTANNSLQDSLVGHWTFDGPDISWADTTSEIKDRSDSGNVGDAVNIGTTNASIGKIGQALSFNGTDNFINTNYSPNLGANDDFTISMWVKPDKIAFSADEAFIGARIGNDLLFIEIEGDNSICATNELVVYVTSENSNNSDTLCSATQFNESEWRHVSWTFDVDGQTTVYINGNLEDSTAVTAFSSGIKNFSANPFYIGAVNWVGNNQYYEGLIDDVRVYNRALSADEVAQLYRMGGGVTMTPCGAKTVTDADGNVYGTVQIGNQCWMAENLRVGTTVNGSTAQTDNSTIERWCYDNDDDNCDVNLNPNNPDGGLYQWDEMMQYSTTEGAQGICPAGWHIPTDDEWKTLELALGMSPAVVDNAGLRGTDQGTQLKPNGSSGFEGNLAGFGFFGPFFFRGSDGYWWSASESFTNAWGRSVSSSESRVGRGQYSKGDGLSVRCLED